MLYVQHIEVEWRIYASVNYTINGSDNNFLPVQRQAIIGPNEGLLLMGPSGTNLSEMSIKMNICFKKSQLQMSSENIVVWSFALVSL